MDDKSFRVAALEEKYSHQIMLSLLNNPRQKKTELLQSISKSSCMPRRLKVLEEAGFVEVERDTFDNNIKWVCLTERGTRIAELLAKIQYEASRD